MYLPLADLASDEPSPSDIATHNYTTKDIVYLCVVGVLCLMTISEMMVFNISYTFTFLCVHRSSKRLPERILSIAMIIILYTARTILLLMMASVLPLPWGTLFSLPSFFSFISEGVGVVLVVAMLVVPATTSVWQMATKNNRKEVLALNRRTSSYPKASVVVVMPVYNEQPDVLFKAVCSVVDSDFPKEHLHLFISFDDDAQSKLFLALMSKLGLPPPDDDYEYPPLLELFFRSVQITVSRFPHGGKRLTQKKTFALINSIYSAYSKAGSKLFVLFIDSDIILYESTIFNFMWDMELNPASPGNYLGLTGVIAITSSGEDKGFMSIMQDMEYVHGQLFGRAIESAAGSVICMPGALTLFRYSDFVSVADEYFAERPIVNIFDFGRSHLGEDRYLTHLLMLHAPQSHRIRFCQKAICKTEAVFTMANLLKQRRRWFMGFITNEAALLSDDRLWRKYPTLLAFCLMRNVVNNSALYGYVVTIGIIFGYGILSPIWLVLILLLFGVNYLLIIAYGLRLGRYKTLLYPVLFFIAPFVSWYMLLYSVFTANQRTWGGPRITADTPKHQETKADSLSSSLGRIDEGYMSSKEEVGDHDPNEKWDVRPEEQLLMYPKKALLSKEWWNSHEDLRALDMADPAQLSWTAEYAWSETTLISRTLPMTLDRLNHL